MRTIKVTVITGNAFQVKADTLVLKYAQMAYGLDRDIIRELESKGHSIVEKLPKVWEYFFTGSDKVTNTNNILFVGVPPLPLFGYKEIRQFGAKLLVSLASSYPAAKSVALTVHGPGFGLDETEAFESLVAGIVDSITSEAYPGNLQEIIFVERSQPRSERLQGVLVGLFPDGYIPTTKSDRLKEIETSSIETLRSAGYESESKKRVFVAMPFSNDFDDSFHYGIQGAVNASGYLCERADLQSFTGDVMDWVKSRISTADFVIADLTTANPNVYLEVGYAWGKNKKTILLIKDAKELKFDTRGQRCLPYTSIKDLETKLRTELENLKL